MSKKCNSKSSHPNYYSYSRRTAADSGRIGSPFSNLANFIQYLSAFATSFLLSFFLRNDGIGGFTPHATGFILLTQPLMQVLFSPLAGTLSDCFAARRLASGDLYGVASGIMATGRVRGMSLSLSTTAVVFNLFNCHRDRPDAFLNSFHFLFVIFSFCR